MSNGDYADYEDTQSTSVYENEEIREHFQVSESLKNVALTDLLLRDSEIVKQRDHAISWYHGKIPRESAEAILKEGLASRQGQKSDGLFLIRDSTSSEKDFVVSVTNEAKVYHFQIKEVFDGHYKLDEGPITQGLEKLVAYYQAGSNGLITRLMKHCTGLPPPDRARYTGQTNLLHKAVIEGDVGTVELIIQHKNCPDLNAKNEWGGTALHDASRYGRLEIANMLIKRGADIHAKDRAGFTPLHRACAANHEDLVCTLINLGKADPQHRAPKTGWVALHEAAMRGNAKCIQRLLEFNAPMMPRADDRQTPLDLAKRYNRIDCIPLLSFPDKRKVYTKKEYWYHPDLNRQGATMLLEEAKKEEGLFLVRQSTRNVHYHVISLCHKKALFNFEIKVEDYDGLLVHYIDDGPYFENLEQLISHYSHYMDGLSAKLRASINTRGERIEIDDEYCSLTGERKERSSLDLRHSKPPELKPRPPREEEEDLYSAPQEEEPSPTPPPLPPSHPPSKSSHMTKKEPPPQLGDRQPSMEEFHKIEKKDIKLGNELGQGEFGAVRKAVYSQKMGAFRTQKIDVAVKTFHEEDAIAGALSSIMEEARLMQRLNHNCIVKLYGICEKPFMLVEEFISKGSLLDNLIDNRKNIKVNPTLYLWAAQIAEGMEYLEGERIVHRDLAARNILVQSMSQVKISDFGLSRSYEEKNYYQASKGGRWPIKWYAPECVNYGKFTHKTDVWSYGITLWEMFSWGDQPYGDMKGIEVMQFIESGKRLHKPNDCPQSCYEQMLSCWQAEADMRPRFRDLFYHFQEDQEYASVKDIKRTHNKKEKRR